MLNIKLINKTNKSLTRREKLRMEARAQVSGRAADLARKKSYGCRFDSSCEKLAVVFEREKCNAQEMDILPRNRANGLSPAKTWQT